MHNAGRDRSALRFAVICACLLLAFSVFAWGLHAKLSLYEAHVAPAAASSAKLLLTQKTGRDLVAMTTAPASPDLHVLSLALFAAVLVLPLLRVHWLEPENARGRGPEQPWHSTVWSRPPPMAANAR